MDQGDFESYLDYETFLDPSFSPTSFANTLVLATNDLNDSPLDLTTPLSRVLFDVQEVDTHLDKLAGASAVPLLNYTKENVHASERILHELDTQIASLSNSYERLEREVVNRYEAAEETRLAGSRVWETLKLGRAAGRCLTLARQLEAQVSDLKGAGLAIDNKEDSETLVRGANTILALRQIFDTCRPGGEAEGLDQINVIRTLRNEMVDLSERSIISHAEQIVAQFSLSSLTTQNGDLASSSTLSSSLTYSQTENTKSRATSALVTLYLLSPVSASASTVAFEPTYLVSALQEYLRRAITSSLAGVSSALATLPKLDRTLVEVSARCQNIVALEMLLGSVKPPPHPLLTVGEPDVEARSIIGGREGRGPINFLQPLLSSLDTSSLPSYFWRSMASQLTTRVQRILKDGGVSARTLRSNKDRVRDSIRQCVNRGSTLPAGSTGRANGTDTVVGNWEREAAVMVGSVINALGK